MLSIGEFSNICKVSTKTLRYYAAIGLLSPEVINPETGYRYYSMDQLEIMLMIGRLKTYEFSLEEIKEILSIQSDQNTFLFKALINKQNKMKKQLYTYQQTLIQLEQDIMTLKQGYSILSYLDDIKVTLVEIPKMNILSIRKLVREHEMERAYSICFNSLNQKIMKYNWRMQSYPLVLFHNSEFTSQGMDIEFAMPIHEAVSHSRVFDPGLCLKTTLYGSYKKLPSVYTKHIQWANQYGYQNQGALFEVYINDPSVCESEDELITEIYYPIIKGK